MNDAELVQDLRDDANRLEREAGDSCLHTDTIGNLREAAARIEATADLLAACEASVEELTDGKGGWPQWDETPWRVQCALNELRAAITKAKGEQP